MAIRVQTAGRTDLRLATRVDKVNFNTARTIAGTANQVRGNWQAVFLRMPSGLTTNADFNLLGHNAANEGLFTGSNPGDARLRIASNTVATVARRLRPTTERRSGNTLAYDATTWLDIDQVPTGTGTSFIYIEGIRNVAAQGDTPNWVAFAAICPVNGGAPSVQVQTTNSGYISGNGAMLSQIIVAQNGTANRITPAGFVFEQYLLAEGDFPWDTSTDAGVTGAGRPHLDALRALANGANPPGTLHTYDSLIAAQNAGTLGYANLDSGRSEKRIHYTLENLSSAGLTEQVAGTNNLTVTTQAAPGDGLVVENTILPAHWAPNTPVITDPHVKFWGGRGLLPVVISGTHTGNVERRWVLAGTNTPVPGFDWALRIVTNGDWSTSDTLPFGHYDLQVRDATTPANVATLPDILVGTKLLFHGQSGMALAILVGSEPPNPDNLAVASGAQGILCRLTNNNAPGGTTTMNPARLVSGQVPSQSYTAIELLNRWNALNPGHPLMINVMAINGTDMDADWATNATIGGWTFLGAVTDGVGAGVVGFWAWFLSQQIDGHVVMWHPGMGDSEAGRQQYIDAIDARFANSPQAPWIILPSWRGHRASTGNDGIVTRDNAVRMVQELGPRGYLGSQWSDILADGNPLPPTVNDPGSLHPARKGSGVVSDDNVVGASRAARGLAAEGARLFNQEVQRTFRIGGITPSDGGAWSDNGGATVHVELGRKARTLNGAAIHTPMISVSLNNGSNWNNEGDTFTAAFDATGTRLVLTPTAGNLAAWQNAFSNGTLRVDYGRVWPFSPATGNLNEATIEPAFDGLIYDMATWRGRDNLAVPAGNVLQGTNRSAGANAGVPVVAKGNPKLVTTERMSGPRTVTLRMRRASDNDILAEKTFVINTADPFEEPGDEEPPDPGGGGDPPDPNPGGSPFSISYFNGEIEFIGTAASTGTYADGSYWIADGEVTAMNPPFATGVARTFSNNSVNPSTEVHGWMVDPGNAARYRTGDMSTLLQRQTANSSGGDQAYDSLVIGTSNLAYDPTRRQPLPQSAGALVKARSILTNVPTDGRPVVLYKAVLTMVQTPPPAGSIRPPIARANKTPVLNVADYLPGRLRNLDVTGISGLPSFQTAMSWLGGTHTWQHNWNVNSRNIVAMNDPTLLTSSGYMGTIAGWWGEIMLAMHTNHYTASEKEQLAIQIGKIAGDIAGAMYEGRIFPPNGGHCHGRLPILAFAAELFDNAYLREACGLTALVTNSSRIAFGQSVFGDLSQLHYITQAQIDGSQGKAWPWPQEALGWPTWSAAYGANPNTRAGGNFFGLTVQKVPDNTGTTNAASYYPIFGKAAAPMSLALRLVVGATPNVPQLFHDYADRHAGYEISGLYVLGSPVVYDSSANRMAPWTRTFYSTYSNLVSVWTPP